MRGTIGIALGRRNVGRKGMIVMTRTIFAGLFVAAVVASPWAAWAQKTTQMQEPNLNNPQAQANQARQKPNAHRVNRGPGAGSVRAIPTPTLPGQEMSKIPQSPGVPHSDAIR